MKPHSPELIWLMGGVGAIYGAIQTGIAYNRARGEMPPLGLLARAALSEAVEWSGAMFLTDLMMTETFPEQVRTLGTFLTTAMWLEAIFPRLIGER